MVPKEFQFKIEENQLPFESQIGVVKKMETNMVRMGRFDAVPSQGWKSMNLVPSSGIQRNLRTLILFNKRRRLLAAILISKVMRIKKKEEVIYPISRKKRI